MIKKLGLKYVLVAWVAEVLNYVANSEMFASSEVKGLAELLKMLEITEHLSAAEAFCVLHGAKDVADLKRHNTQHGANDTYAKELATKLNLPTILAERFFEAIDALPARE